MVSQALAEVLAQDYANAGWGTIETEGTITGPDGTELALEVIGGSDGAATALQVFHNGDMLDEISYKDPEFGVKLGNLVASYLEPIAVH